MYFVNLDVGDQHYKVIRVIEPVQRDANGNVWCHCVTVAQPIPGANHFPTLQGKEWIPATSLPGLTQQDDSAAGGSSAGD